MKRQTNKNVLNDLGTFENTFENLKITVPLKRLCDKRTDRLTDGPTKMSLKVSRSKRLKAFPELAMSFLLPDLT